MAPASASTVDDPLAGGLQAIIEAAADVLGASTLKATLTRMADALAPIVPYTSLAVYEYDEATLGLRPMLALGSYVEEMLASRPDLDASSTGRAVKTGEIIVLGPGDNPSGYVVPGTPTVDDESLVVVPLLVGSNPIGTLNVWREQEHHGFSAAEILLLRSFAMLAAMAYSNARQADVLREQALRDPLTGVYNRRHYEHELRAALREPAVGGALLLLDVDWFKTINDTYGHPVGDAVLRVLATTLDERRGEDGSVYRLGGDEFAVLLRGAGRREAEAWMAGARRALAARGAELPCPVAVSAGLAVIRADDDLETVSHRADVDLLGRKRGRSAPASPAVA